MPNSLVEIRVSELEEFSRLIEFVREAFEHARDLGDGVLRDLVSQCLEDLQSLRARESS